MASWIDAVIVLVPVGGIVVGAYRGVLRQVALMVAFYISLVFAARYYADAAGYLVRYVPQADRTVASAYALAAMTAAGTLLLAWLFRSVYRTTALPRIRVFDRLFGAGLGVAWSWAVLAFALTTLLYGLSFSWGPSDPLREQLSAAVDRSALLSVLRLTLPYLRELLHPWLPGGLPAALSV